MHTQILHFVGGIKRTIPNIIKVYENEMCHILTADGVEWIINKNNLLAVEKLPEKMSGDWGI
jgi:hypothetical protein